MKNNNVLITTAIFFLLTVIFFGCQNLFEPSHEIKNQDPRKGAISLSIGGQDTTNIQSLARTIIPTTLMDDFVKFDLDFTAKTSGNIDFSISWANNSGTVALNVGIWDLSVTAYLDNGEGGFLEAAHGEYKGFFVPSGNTVAVNVPLYPGIEGQGTFSWNISYPATVSSAAMEIIRLDEGAPPYQGIFSFTGGTPVGINDKLMLDSGQYRVVFKLSNGEEEASLSEIVHVYKNMESNFAQVFSDKHFPVTLLKFILSAWDNTFKKWNFTGNDIAPDHFSWLGINGIDDNNFEEITGLFNDLCASFSTPLNLNGFKSLVDAAHISIAITDADFTDAFRYVNQILAENAVSAIAPNKTGLLFAWGNDGKTLSVQAGTYEMEIVFNAVPLAPTPGLAFALINGNTAYSVSRGTADAVFMVIPPVYQGLPVTAIANNGFSGYRKMIGITILGSVTSIGDGAFYNCSGLTSITIPRSVTSIGDLAFRACSGLTSVTIPEGVTGIGDGAFANCTGLTSITISTSVTSIGGWAFSDCGELESITVDSGNAIYRSEGNCLIRITDNVLIAGCKNSIIPEGVTGIGDSAFASCTGLTSITIPEGVTGIDDWAFSSCSGLMSITIPEGVTGIGDGAFANCTGLTSITIPGSVISIGRSAFSGCTGLTSITIPDSVTSIGDYAFNACTGLASIMIPDSAMSIGSRAFWQCSLAVVFFGGTDSTAWNSINIDPDNNSAITNATRLYYSETQPGTIYTHWRYINDVPVIWNIDQMSETQGLSFTLINGGTAYSVRRGLGVFSAFVVIPSIYQGLPVVAIADSGFGNQRGIISITIPNSVTSIGDGAFQDCSGLTSITIPNSVTSIGRSAFYNCSGLTSITIPASVTSIGDGAFANCSGLTSITVDSSNTIYRSEGDCLIRIMDNVLLAGCKKSVIPHGVTSIGSSAFIFCSGLTSITIPGSVTSIGYRAFYYCSGLTSITIPGSVTSIGDGAFANCTGLTSITIPGSVTSIGDGAFNCSGLTSITVDSGNTIYRSEGNCLIRIADNVLLTGCKNSVIPHGVTSIGSSAFISCSGLTSITIPSSVTSIGSQAFQGCNRLAIVFFGGTDSSAWNSIATNSGGNSALTNAARFYYSETQPETVYTHWRWVNGVPTIWGEALITVITINTHPAPMTKLIEGNISGNLNVSINGGTKLSYQWYSNTTASNTGGVLINGATSASFTIPMALTAGTYYYYCVVSDAGGSAAPVSSNTATVAVTVGDQIDQIEMVWVPGGSFELGKELNPANGGDITPVSTVTLTGFYIGKYPVTQAQYQAVMGTNPSYFDGGSGREPAGGENQGRRPVEQVSWYDAIEFCNKLSEREGLIPYYNINKGQTDPNNLASDPYKWLIIYNKAADGYRLPTEAQWEYAAKGGNGTSGNYTYAGSNTVENVAWYNGNSGGMTHEVGKKDPNRLDIYDMSGNVQEWCWDWDWGSYTGGTDPMGASSGTGRVLRGGNWSGSAVNARSVARSSSVLFYQYYVIGFRLARPQF